MRRAIFVPLSVLALASLAAAAPPDDAWRSFHGHGRLVQTPLGHLYLEEEGAGPPVIIVSGGPGDDHTRYHPWFSRLATEHRVIYFDNYGCGRSDRLARASDYSIETHAQGIEEIRKAIGADQVSVVGVSYGGLPALEYALAHPEHVERLVLSNAETTSEHWQRNIDTANAIIKAQWPEIWRDIMALRARGMRSSAIEIQKLYGRLEDDLFWLNRLDHPALTHTGHPGEAVNIDVYTGIVGDDPEWKVTGSLAHWDPIARMRKARVPTLIAVGRYDRIATPEMAFETAAALPSGLARTVVFERSAHRPWIEEPDAYFALLREFLGRSVKR